MSKEPWSAIDRYLLESVAAPDPVLEAALADSAAAGLPAIAVSAVQGRMLMLLARLQQARMILEIGTLGGYSTICLARGLAPGGRVVSLEIEPRHAEVARKNLNRAGLASAVEVRLGPALETLEALHREGFGPCDFVFIDADKEHTAEYFDWAVRLSRPGGLIVVDNVVRQGAVVDAKSKDVSVRGVRRFFERLKTDSRIEATAIQMVGAKGHDGFAVAVKV